MHLMMKSTSNRRVRHRFVVASTTLAAAAAVIAGTLASPASATQRGSSQGPGYPPPGGIYAPFTDCPLLNPLMQESMTGGLGMGCVAGVVSYGSFTVGSTVVPVAHPVIAQFGLWDPPGNTGNQFEGGVLPPPDGKQLVASPENVPGGLLKALGCPSSTPAVEKLCKEAVLPGESTVVKALVQTAGPITNFQVTTWTQPVKIKLINPLLGNYCYLGSTDNPIMLNPSVTGTISAIPDPNPTRFPTTAVLEVTNAVATDTTFSVPIAQGCGPGGSANIAIDTAIDTSESLPSPSGSNSLVLNGNFYLAIDFSQKNNANDLLAAFNASDGTPPMYAPSARRIGSVRGLFGIKP
jgi:hypothetical protein